MSKCKCGTCDVYKKILKSKKPTCCRWYMDNVVVGGKSLDDCTEYKSCK